MGQNEYQTEDFIASTINLCIFCFIPGTHGHMKCVFDGQLKSQDTVLMNIYKRIFPKWTYEPHVNWAPSMYWLCVLIKSDLPSDVLTYIHACNSAMLGNNVINQNAC